MSYSKLKELSMDLAVNTIKMCDSIHRHYSLVNQLERRPHQSGQISVRQIMRTGEPISLPNFRLHSKNVMKQNTGLNFLSEPNLQTRNMQKICIRSAALSANSSSPQSPPQKRIHKKAHKTDRSSGLCAFSHSRLKISAPAISAFLSVETRGQTPLPLPHRQNIRPVRHTRPSPRQDNPL